MCAWLEMKRQDREEAEAGGTGAGVSVFEGSLTARTTAHLTLHQAQGRSTFPLMASLSPLGSPSTAQSPSLAVAAAASAVRGSKVKYFSSVKLATGSC